MYDDAARASGQLVGLSGEDGMTLKGRSFPCDTSTVVLYWVDKALGVGGY